MNKKVRTLAVGSGSASRAADNVGNPDQTPNRKPRKSVRGPAKQPLVVAEAAADLWGNSREPAVEELHDVNDSPLSERLSFYFHTISARIALIGNQHFREYGLNHYSARILILLLEMQELRTGELVDLLLLPQSTITNQLQGLHKRRLIRRRRSRQDNRSVFITLTPLGMELARDCNQLSVIVQNIMVQSMSEAERKRAYSFLAKVDERLGAIQNEQVYQFKSKLPE